MLNRVSNVKLKIKVRFAREKYLCKFKRTPYESCVGVSVITHNYLDYSHFFYPYYFAIKKE